MGKLVIPSIVANGGSGGSSYTAGTGIAISNNTISTKIDNSTIKVNENGQLYSEGGSSAFKPFPEDFNTTTEEFLTFEQFIYNIRHSSGAGIGNTYVGEIFDYCLPWLGEGNAECTVVYITDEEAVLTVSSSDILPYYWTYNTASSLGSTPDYKWKSSILQVTTMPSRALQNTIVQYVGTTTSDYTQGYFYKCNVIPGTPKTYEWVQTNVQPAAIGGLVLDIGQAQESYQGYVIPKIEKADAISAYEAFTEGKHVVLLWTLLGTETYLNIVSADDIGGIKSIDVCLHNQYHIAYSWSENTGEYCNFEVSGTKEITDTTSTNITLDAVADTIYKYGTLTNLTLSTIETSNKEIIIYFTAGTNMTISLPNTLNWINKDNIADKLVAGERYIISIVNNIAIYATY